MLFIGIEDKVQVPMCIKNPPSDKTMSFLLSNFFDSFDEGLIDGVASELSEQFIIVYLLTILCSNLIWSDFILILFFLLFHFCRLFDLFGLIILWIHVY